ncbi:MAG TPA: hypothetical protein DDW33_05555 [Ktedonobacter sp.]|jgi:hypothetical protein|nr:hypothetical protein [Ktedonobacter sp.]HCP75630.1 hypothetical protein [Ktedonobacter sp.]
MISLWKAYQAKVVHLSALLLMLLFSLVSLVSCNQPAPAQYVSLKLGIPAAALQSPVKGPLPDATVLHVGVTFKIDPRLLGQADHQKLQPGQRSNLEVLANRLGIDDATYQKIKQFFHPRGIILNLSKLRTHLSIQAQAGTLAKVLQTKFVIRQYKGRTFYAPATPPKVPAFLANAIDAITGLGDDSPCLKTRGFSGSLRCLNPPSEGKDIDCSIVVSIQLSATLATMPAITEFLFADLSTTATHLTGISGIDLYDVPTGPCSLVGTELYKLTPTSIIDRFVQAAFGRRAVGKICPIFILFGLRPLAHVGRLHLFKHNRAIGVDKLP